MSDGAASHHVGAVTDARGLVTNRGSGDTEFLQVIETGNTRAVAANTGIVEDRGTGVQSRRKVGGIDPTMRGIDHYCASGFRSDPRNTVSNDDRRSHRGAPHPATMRW